MCCVCSVVCMLYIGILSLKFEVICERWGWGWWRLVIILLGALLCVCMCVCVRVCARTRVCMYHYKMLCIIYSRA